MLDYIKNKTIFANKYRTHSEAIIIACYFNPQGSDYRLKAFNIFYDSIKHLNHRIIECVIGESTPQLPENKNISRVYTSDLLWHKEAGLNKIIRELPTQYKYVFWLDTDIIFTNKDWLTDSVLELQSANIVQPFELCVHLEKDEEKPGFVFDDSYTFERLPNRRNNKVWRSFCATYADWGMLGWDEDYNNHGHVGLAWGARREILDIIPLYDKALIGGADHIIAHAAAGQIPHKCIAKSFTDDIEGVETWSQEFYKWVDGKIGYASGSVFHIWHGDLSKRQYLKRIKDFTSKTKDFAEKDENGFYTHNDNDTRKYVHNYFDVREVKSEDQNNGFLTSMAVGYLTDSAMIGAAAGGNLIGAMIGDMMNTSDINEHNHDHENFS